MGWGDQLRKLLTGRGGVEKPPRPRSAVVGAWGEEEAAAFLKARGFTVLGRNVRPDRHDELDIVARTGETLVFVEVKSRRRGDFARPMTAVDGRKRHALNRAAAAYLRRAGYPDLFYRFDVVEVLGEPEEGAPVIRHTEDAFPFERRFVFPV
jgi:putative endonuclease